jgi:VanZ family protein
MLKKNRNIALLLWLFILAMVVAGSLYPGAGPPKTAIRSDLILHFVVYSLLSGLAMIIFNNRKTALLILMVAIAMLSLGFLLEFAQLYIKGRVFDMDDLIANSIGVITGLLVGFTINTNHKCTNC